MTVGTSGGGSAASRDVPPHSEETALPRRGPAGQVVDRPHPLEHRRPSPLVALAAPRAHVATCATATPVGDSISVRELRNKVSEVLRRVEGGARVTVTVDRRPVAEIVPMRRRRRVPASEALTVAARHASDPRLLDDVRGLLSDSTDEA